GEAPGVDRVLQRLGVLRAPGLDVGALLLEVGAQDRELPQALDVLLLEEAHGGEVDVEAALDAPAARRLHAAPVLERLAEELVGGDDREGLVPVLDGDVV